MEPFECQGHWWTPNRPERCAGTLRCDESGELRLYLFGTLDPSADTGEELPLVFGEIVKLAGADRDTTPKGDCVTLRHSFVSNQRHGSSGPSTQTLFAHRAFFGDTHLANGERLDRAQLYFSGLAGWAADVTGITVGADPYSRSWVRPAAIRCTFPRGTLLLNVGVVAHDIARRWALDESVSFHLTYRSPVTDSILTTDVWALQNFLTFATDRPNALVRLEVQQEGDENHTPFRVTGPTVFAAESADEVKAHEVLFGHTDVRNRLEDVIGRWFELAERHSAAFALYFGLKYNPPRYSDHRFQLMAQALSLYFARGARHKPLISLPYKYADVIEPAVRDELLRTHPFVILSNALETLTDQHAAVFDPLINAHDDQSRLSFLAAATRTFQYVMGRASGAPPEESRGTTYHWLTELLGFLWKCALLDELGFTTEQQQELFARNRMYQHIRQQVAPEMFGATRANP